LVIQNCKPAPDFGAFFGVRAFNTETARGGTSYSYRVADLPKDIDDIIAEYRHLVEQNLFEHTGYITRDDNSFAMFYNSRHGVMLSFGVEMVRNRECFTVTVS